jgi:DNA-directed RNA polymerase specialized sigma24 family protein
MADQIATRPARYPELAAVTPKELQALFESLYRVALALTRSRARAEEVVENAFERLLTTRRWNPGKAPLAKHLAYIVKSLVMHEESSTRPERDQAAAEGFYRETETERAESSEQKNLLYAESASRQAEAARELEELRASVAHQPLVSEVLRKREEGLERAADVAQALGVPVERVYRANEVLREHLKRIRQSRKK